MKTNVWILNHYSGDMYLNNGGRHYWFAKFLNKKGYKPVVFCANTNHDNKGRKIFNTTKLWEEHISTEINTPFVFVKAREYVGNGKKRILNMIDFYQNIKIAAKQYSKSHGRPDVIVASSVHPLTLVAGIKLAKYFGVKCICEVRDLWPESLVAYGYLNPNSIIAKLLYKGEKWIYKKADSVIMTWEGGMQYICDRGWDDEIPSKKVFHICNGVDFEEFRQNSITNTIVDDDMDNKSFIKVCYTGSVREVNNLDMIVEAAQLLKDKADNVKFVIYGEGSEREVLIDKCQRLNLQNIVFKGSVPKKFVPSILNRADICLLHNKSTSLDCYGQSQNKLFEYLASGSVILQTYSTGYSVCEKYKCGIMLKEQSSEEIAKAILSINADKHILRKCKENAVLAAKDYDFKNLTEKLIKIIEKKDE